MSWPDVSLAMRLMCAIRDGDIDNVIYDLNDVLEKAEWEAITATATTALAMAARRPEIPCGVRHFRLNRSVSLSLGQIQLSRFIIEFRFGRPYMVRSVRSGST